SNSNSVTVIDGATNNTTTVAVGNTPWAVAVNPNTNQIYVVNSYLLQTGGNVTVIDGATNNTTTVATGANALSYGDNPWDLAVNSMTNQIYVAYGNGGNVTVIDG